MSFKFVHLDKVFSFPNVELFSNLIFLTAGVETFVSSICNLESFISISSERIFKFEDQSLIPELKLPPQGMITKEYRREINLYDLHKMTINA